MNGPAPVPVEEVAADPMAFLGLWIDEGSDATGSQSRNVALCTVDEHHRPSIRNVPVRSVGPSGLTIFTSLVSEKGRDLLRRPDAVGCLFSWLPLLRQVRLDVTAEVASAEESDRAFAGRPRGGQLQSWVSAQPGEVDDRSELVTRLREVEARFDGIEVPRPEDWSVVLLVPRLIEYWQAHSDGLHDRIRCRRVEGGWSVQRLVP